MSADWSCKRLGSYMYLQAREEKEGEVEVIGKKMTEVFFRAKF
jgi:hypothetical protein